MKVVVVAFGAEYVGLAKSLAIASLMSPGNVPAVGARLRVFTDLPDEIPGSVRIKAEGEKHEIVSEIYRAELVKDEPVIIMPPDCVISDCALMAVQKHIEAGKRLIAAPAVRLNRDTVLPEFENDGVLSLTPRELAAIGLRNLHPGTDCMFAEAKPFTGTPYQVYRRQADGITANCYHMHPLMIRWKGGPMEKGTVDDGLVNQFNPRDVHVVTDSDEIAFFETSAAGYSWQKPPVKYSQQFIADWARRKANPMHKWFYGHECRIHA